MRRLSRLASVALTLAAVACASAGSPPGGPPDTEPPAVIEFSPDSGTVGFSGRAVTVRFDETISDRGTGAASMKDMGKVVAARRAQYAGRLDFGKACGRV